MKSNACPADLRLKDKLFRFTEPKNLPISFRYGDREIHGIPEDFAPTVEKRWLDNTMLQYVICGKDACGLEIRVEYVEYLDFAGTELIAFFTNKGEENTQKVSDLCIIDGVLPLNFSTLYHGNGDTKEPDGYEWEYEALDHPIRVATADGTSCNGVFPYLRLLGENMGVNLGVGWPVSWKGEFIPTEGGVHIKISQRKLDTVLYPGETLRTPRVNFLGYTGDEIRGMNTWRRWYFAHIMPLENGKPLEPKLCLHVYRAEGKPEFTGANEQNQCGGLQDYIDKGLTPDIWWFDAGWYPCDDVWRQTGDWRADPERFPNGLGCLGQKCEENGVQLMLWFEPERARDNSPLALEHPEWMLRVRDAEGNLVPDCLVDLGSDECCDYMIDLVDRLMKEYHVHIYRQDFNISYKVNTVQDFWDKNDAPDRVGALENHHAQGYLKYWDGLRERNPGMWIDSCAGGGRRNDLETMRRAVPLHYTDVGYGHHPIKQKQHYQMFQWIPYFRAHNENWDDPVTGEYIKGNKHAPDRFSYHCAMAPSMTDIIEHDASDEAFALAKEMRRIWHKAATLMLTGDYYPLTPCRKSAEDFYAVEFYDGEKNRGYLQVIRNNKVQEDTFTACLQGLEADAVYTLCDEEHGESFEMSGKALMEGLQVTLPIRTAKILFFEKK